MKQNKIKPLECNSRIAYLSEKEIDIQRKDAASKMDRTPKGPLFTPERKKPSPQNLF